VHTQSQLRLQLLVRVARGGSVHQNDNRGAQCSMRREPDAPIEPESATIELRQARQRVEAPRVAEAGAVPDAAEGAEDGGPGAGAQRLTKLVERSDGRAAEESPQRGCGRLGSSHGTS
jgi:hypothetical protein